MTILLPYLYFSAAYQIMPETASLDDLHMLANSIRRSYNRLRHTTDQIHAASGITAPKRTLMMDLNRDGPQTVPALASARFISRQIIQTQVNELKTEGYLKATPNPQHKRSVLIALTASGKAMVKKMIQAENVFIKKLGWLPGAEELSTCQQVLDDIYERLDQDTE
jgi:DNA-binding MarR family transcriptional regulator